MYTQEKLADQIRAMGVKPDDLLTVHTSLRSVGVVDTSEKTSAEVLLDALRSCVPEGLLMIPSHTFASVVEDAVFHIRETKPCVGAVPCVAVEMANRAVDNGDETCIRSMHPSHSVVAFGKKAREFAAHDRATRTKHSMAGCYGRLYYDGGKILLIGVNLTTNTFIHAVDEMLDGRVDRVINTTMTDYDGSTWEQELQLTGVPGSSTFSRYTEPLEKAGGIVYGKIGDAVSMLVDARICYEVVSKIRRTELFEK